VEEEQIGGARAEEEAREAGQFMESESEGPRGTMSVRRCRRGRRWLKLEERVQESEAAISMGVFGLRQGAANSKRDRGDIQCPRGGWESFGFSSGGG